MDCSEKEVVESWGWVLLTYGSGKEIKHIEFRAGPWTAVRRKLVESWAWVLLTYGLGKQIKTLNLGWVFGLQ